VGSRYTLLAMVSFEGSSNQMVRKAPSPLRSISWWWLRIGKEQTTPMEGRHWEKVNLLREFAPPGDPNVTRGKDGDWLSANGSIGRAAGGEGFGKKGAMF